MKSQFPYLFSSLRIGSLRLKNRIVSTAHACGLAENGRITDRYLRYHEEKAIGGAGLIMVGGSSSPHPTSPVYRSGEIHNWDGEVIPDFRRLSEAIHRHDAAVFCQITHRGRRRNHDRDWLPAYAPSPIPEQVHRDMPHEIQKEDIQPLVDAYAQAARRAREGGLDGVEILAGHGHLIDQFWSPISNRRTDEFGGGVENRMRFASMVFEAVRDAVGPDFVVCCRMQSDELLDGGLTLEDEKVFFTALARTGLIDLFNIPAATTATDLTQAMTIPSMSFPLGVFVPLAAEIKRMLQGIGTDIPIIAVGRIVHPRQAEDILAAGQADLVAMTRALIADPHLPQKTAEDRLDDIRLCMGINEGCIGRVIKGKPISCDHNPIVGREAELATIEAAARRKRVVVVGGGPAGLEAARVAALRGHEVVLFERLPQLGGQLLLAARTPKRADLALCAGWLESQVRKLPVDLRLGVEAAAGDVLAEKPDHVVIATGSCSRLPEIPGVNSPVVLPAREVLEGAPDLGERVVLIDEHHGYEGLPIAEFLATRGHKVTVVSRLFVAGEDISSYLRPELYARLDELKIRILPLTEVRKISDDGVVEILHVYSRRALEPIQADSVIVAALGRANDSLWKEMKEATRIPVSCIGDAFAPRGMHEAILEGTRVAREI